MRNPRVYAIYMVATRRRGLRPRARACTFHKTLGLMPYHKTVPVQYNGEWQPQGNGNDNSHLL